MTTRLKKYTYIGNSVNGGGNIGITVQMIMVIEHVLTKMILFFSQIVLHCSYFTLVKVSKFSWSELLVDY